MTDDERQIRDLVRAWTDATRRGDLATVLGLMTEDVVFMTPDGEPFGREAFEAAAGAVAEAGFDSISEIVEIEVLGDWAFMRTHLDIRVTPPGDSPVEKSGYTLTILRKGDDGRWRIARDANLLT